MKSSTIRAAEVLTGAVVESRRSELWLKRAISPLFRLLIQTNWRFSDATGCTFGRSTWRSRPRRRHKIQVQSVADTHRPVAIDASLLCPRRPDFCQGCPESRHKSHRPRVRRFTRGLGDAGSCARSLAVRGRTEGFTRSVDILLLKVEIKATIVGDDGVDPGGLGVLGRSFDRQNRSPIAARIGVVKRKEREIVERPAPKLPRDAQYNLR